MVNCLGLSICSDQSDQARRRLRCAWLTTSMDRFTLASQIGATNWIAPGTWTPESSDYGNALANRRLRCWMN
jgi:hypothetical protein